VDQEHANSYTAWKQMGSPASLTPDQERQLTQAGMLEPAVLKPQVSGATVRIPLGLERQGITLLRLSW
jgi:xylan 1,4-beta-xylosidase